MPVAAADLSAPRPVGEAWTSERPFDELQACIYHRFASVTRVTIVPFQGGTALEGAFRFGLTPPGQAPLAFEIREQGSTRQVSASYRHPFSMKMAAGLLRDLYKLCANAEAGTSDERAGL